MDWSLVGSSNCISSGGHLGLVRRCPCINPERQDYTEASRPKGPVYALISRIHLGSPASVVESAERVAKTILITYSKPNLTAEEIQSGVSRRDDPLREFSIICRHELESLRGSL